MPLSPPASRHRARKPAGPRLAPAAVTAALAALLLAACGYPDRDLRPPDLASDLAPAQPPAPPGEAAAGPNDFGLGTPFVVIRFGPEPVDYEEPLAGAVAEARAQRPDAKFHLLAVAAGGGPDLPRPASLQHAEAVLRSLAALGVPPDEVFVAAATAPDNLIDEVRLYLR